MQVKAPELHEVHDDIVVRQVDGTRRVCDVSRVQYHACVALWVDVQVTGDAGSIILNQIRVRNPLLAAAQRNDLQKQWVFFFSFMNIYHNSLKC